MANPSPQEQARLRELIENSLRQQGFRIRDNQIILPKDRRKEKLKQLHRLSVQHRIEAARPRLGRYEDRLLKRIASGGEIEPAKIAPRLVEVLPDSEDELLFRYASLHWSIPTSSGYGRRLRCLDRLGQECPESPAAERHGSVPPRGRAPVFDVTRWQAGRHAVRQRRSETGVSAGVRRRRVPDHGH